MKENICIYMVVRNISNKLELFTQVIKRASEVSNIFFIVDHWSTDNTVLILEDFKKTLGLQLEIIKKVHVWTMDETKGEFYRFIKNRNHKERKFLLMLDWDEVLDYELIREINNLDYTRDVYLINIQTYLMREIIDRNHFQPRLFEIGAVEINNFSKFHNLFLIKSKNIQKLAWKLRHYSYADMNELLEKSKSYAKWEAEDLFSREKEISSMRLLFILLCEGIKYSLYTLIYHRNFLTLEGWLYSMNWFIYKYYKILFYLELKIKYSNESIRTN